MNPRDETQAVFWCSLLAPVLFGEVSAKETGRFLRELAEKDCAFPDGRRKKPSLSTLRRKLALYRHQGFEALAKRPRSDRGRPRKYTPAMLQRAVELKREQPLRRRRRLAPVVRQLRGTQLLVLPADPRGKGPQTVNGTGENRRKCRENGPSAGRRTREIDTLSDRI